MKTLTKGVKFSSLTGLRERIENDSLSGTLYSALIYDLFVSRANL